MNGILHNLTYTTPILEENSRAADAERRLPDTVFEAMLGAGLFRTLAPKAYGGLELHPVEHCRIIEAVARIDSAAGWCLNQSTIAAGLVPWVADEGVEEAYANGPDVMFAGGFFPPGPSVAVDGGWRVTCRSTFVSGCNRADWFMIPMVEVDATTNEPIAEEPPILAALVPRDEVELIDTWQTVGMRGTFSADVTVENVFVPGHRVAHFDLARPRPTAFSSSLFGLWPWTSNHGETCVSLGIASAAIDKLVALATKKKPYYSRIQLRDREMAQHHVAKAMALVDASRTYLDTSISEAYEEVERDGHYSETTKIRCQLAACWGAESCAKAVDLVYEASGSSAFRIEQGLERHHRDIHVLTQHAYKAYPRYEDVGKLLFGMQPGFWVLDL